jgi:hypothetical protein
MYLIIALGVSILLFAGFLLLTYLESSRQFRLMPASRAKLDRHVKRVAFVVSHVDWSAFIGQLVRNAAEIIVHDVAHATLLVIRALERLLTRIVHGLRTRRLSRSEDPGTVTTVVERIAHLRETLRRARAERERRKKLVRESE